MVQFTYRDLVISLPSGVNATVTDEGVGVFTPTDKDSGTRRRARRVPLS